MVIVGIDPGVAKTGFGVVEITEEFSRMLDYGCVRTSPDMVKEKRLCLIYDEISGILARYKPDVMALERLFFNRNTKTALQVGEASGVIILAAGKAGVPLREYTPIQVKECLAGFGRADKTQVREVVRMELDLDVLPKPIDASDALAIALCHYHLEELDR